MKNQTTTSYLTMLLKQTRSTVILLGLFVALLPSCSFIVNRVVFHPDDIEYHYIKEDHRDTFRETYLTTGDGVKLHAYHVKSKDPVGIMIYFHGNAGNASGRIPDAWKLSTFGYDVLLISYRGYGKSGGSPSEEGIYRDGEAALKYAREKLGFPGARTILYGRSLGTAVAVHAARDRDLKGMILVSPLTTGREYARDHGFSILSCVVGDSFNSLEKIRRVRAPVLIIHGREDTVIPPSMGKKLYQACPSEKKLVLLPGAGHNDISFFEHTAFWDAVGHFLDGLPVR